MASLTACFKKHGISKEDQAQFRQLLSDNKDTGVADPTQAALREAIQIAEADHQELGEQIKAQGGVMPQYGATLAERIRTTEEQQQVQPEADALAAIKQKYQEALLAQDDAAMEESMEEMTRAFMEQEGVTVTPEEQQEMSKKETDLELERAKESVTDPDAKLLLEGKVPVEAVDKKHAELMEKYNAEMKEWEADPISERDDAQKPEQPSRNRALEDVIDEVALKEPEAAELIRWESQDLNAAKTKTKVDKAGDKVQPPRVIHGVRWMNDKKGTVGESIDGKKKYFIQKLGKNKVALWEGEKKIGEFKSRREAQDSLKESEQWTIKKVGSGYKVYKDGQAQNASLLKKKFLAEQLVRDLTANPKLKIGKRVTELNKITTKAGLKSAREKMMTLDDFENMTDEELQALIEDDIVMDLEPMESDEAPFDREGKILMDGDMPTENQEFGEMMMDVLNMFGIYTTNIRMKSLPMGSTSAADVLWNADAGNEIIFRINDWVMDNASGAEKAELVWHETGHMLMYMVFRQSPAAVQQKIFEEYIQTQKGKLEGRLAKMTVEELFKELRPVFLSKFQTRNSAPGDMKKSATKIKSESLAYITGFSEYFADNVVRWAGETKEARTVSESFFKKVANMIKAAYYRLRGKHGTPEEFKKFMDAHLAQVQSGKYDMIGPEVLALDNWHQIAELEDKATNDLLKELGLPPQKKYTGPELLTDLKVEESRKYHEENTTNRRAQFQRGWSKTTRQINDTRKKWFASGIDRIGNISKNLERRANRWVLGISEKNAQYKERVKPFNAAMKKLKDYDRVTVSQLLYNENRAEIQRLYPEVHKGLIEVDKVLNEIKARAEKVGLVLDKEIFNYFPREVSDLKALRAWVSGSKDGSMIRQEIAEAKLRAKELGVEFTPEHEAEVINSMMRTGQYFGSLKKPGALKKRGIKIVQDKMMPFYADAGTSLTSHIHEMNDAIGTYEFLGGKVRRRAMAEFDKVKSDLAKVSDGKKKEALEKRYVELYDDLQNMKNEKYINDSVTEFLADNFQEGELTGDEIDEITDIIRARATEIGMHGVVNSFRNLGLMSTLQDFTSVITQGSEILLSMYNNGILYALRSQFAEKEITAESMDLVNQMLEYQQEGTAKWVAKVLKGVGFQAADIHMKKAFMQAAIMKARKEVNTEAFRAKWEPYFVEDFAALQKELESGKAGPLTRELAWGEQMRFQPLDTLANPEAYMKGGNNRIWYMLKTFQLRQLNAIARESRGMWAGKTKAERLQGLRNMMWLGALAVLGGAGKDELRDLWLGRETPFSEHVYDNMLNLVLFSRYDTDRFKSEGLGKQIIGKIIPATPFLDAPGKDFIKTINGEPTLVNTVGLTPIFGKLIKDRFTETGKTTELNKRKSRQLDAIREAIRNDDRVALLKAKREIRKSNRGKSKDERITNSAISRTISAEKTKMKKQRSRSVVAKHARRLGVTSDIAEANMSKFSELVAWAENRGKLRGSNPKSTAKGMYQITDDTMITALNRLGRDIKPEPWMMEARKHKDANKLESDQQEALFLANLMYRSGTDPLLRKVMETGDVGAMTELYMKHHHTAPDKATLANWEKALERVIGA